MPYILSALLLSIGLYITLVSRHNLKKIFGLMLMQNSAILFFVVIGYVNDGKLPLLKCLEFSHCEQNYTDPVPTVLMLTAIVVGVSTLALALIMAIKLKESHD